MKRYILLAMTLLMASASALPQETPLEKWGKISGNRIDYLNAAGERVASDYPAQNSYAFAAYSNNAPDGFEVVDAWGNFFSSISIVPLGENSYTLEVSTDYPEVSYSCSIATDTNGDGEINYDDIVTSPTRSALSVKAAPENAEIRSGETLLLTLDIPEGTVPDVSYSQLYTMVRQDDKEPYYNDISLPLVNLIRNPRMFPSFEWSWIYYPESRNTDWYQGTGAFMKDPEVKNRWQLIIEMPNEPMNLRIGYTRLDDAMLIKAVGSASRNVYMQREYGNTRPFFSGEPWTMMQCGDAMSPDAYSTLGFNSNPMFESPEFMTNANYWMCSTPWLYYTGMIDMANFYLENLEKFTLASRSIKEAAEGAIRTLRANAYLRMLQIYGPRWEDSSNGAIPVAPLLTEWGKLELPAASMREIADLCKSDLLSAIGKLGAISFVDPLSPDADVARGLLVRLSMLCHEWQTAADQAALLLEEFPLTTNSQLAGGFFSPSDSWIWTAPETDVHTGEDFLYFYSFQSSAAVNGAYPMYWNTGNQLGCIDRDLFLSIPQNDVRRRMFVMPENLQEKPASFYSNLHIDASTMRLTGFGSSPLDLIDDAKPSRVNKTIADAGQDMNVYFGSQFKFWGSKSGFYGLSSDNVCLMRADEFLISRAEALYELDRQDEARECISRLNSMRNSGYSCTASGEALRDEIRLTRRMELWGEGHSFFDFKRWNIPMERKAWVEGDTNSGNWPTSIAGKWQPSDLNGWRLLVPFNAVKYNPNLDISGYSYTNPQGYDEPTSGIAPALRPTEARKAAVTDLRILHAR